MNGARTSMVTGALVVAFGASAYAQAPLEDAEGGSTILVQSSSVSVNSADGSIQLAFEPLSSTKPFFYGLKVKGKAENGLATLFTNGNLNPGIEFGATVGFKLGEGGNAVGLVGSVGAAELTVYDEAAPVDAALSKTTRRTGEIAAVANFIDPKRPVGLVSIAVRGRHRNNWDSLTKAKVVTRTGRPASTDGTTSAETVKETEARVGAFEEGWVSDVAADVMMYASTAHVAPRAYARLGLTGKDSLQETRFGFDVAFVKPSGDPVFDRLASIFVEHVNPSADGAKSKWTVGLSVNVPFSLFKAGGG